MTQRPSITILSGTPGTGKTTVAEMLGALWQTEGGNALHLKSDVFFSFPLAVIPPEKPEARAQNETVSRAVASTALAFATGGYDVILDGVIGPGTLRHYLNIFRELMDPEKPGSLAYVVLRASLEETQTRAATRGDADKFSQSGVRVMHQQFADLKMFESHVLETDGMTAQQTTTKIAAALNSQGFRLSMTG